MDPINPKSHTKNKKQELPCLIGSDKQVKWAKSIRKSVIKKIAIQERSDLIAITSAAFWIQNREDSIEEILEKGSKFLKEQRESRTISANKEAFVIAFEYDPHVVKLIKNNFKKKKWDPDRKYWTVPFPMHKELLEFANECDFNIANEVFDLIEQIKIDKEQAFKESMSYDTDMDIPSPPGLTYFPYQKAGIAYALKRQHTLIGDEMGLGKTIQSIGVINFLSTQNVLVICPASLKINWKRELEKWLVDDLSVGIAGKEFPYSDIVIINYDILKKHYGNLRARVWDLLILDESHYLKNPKAQRTRQIFGHGSIEPIESSRTLCLTGTPIVNRPIEFWPVLHHLLPDEFSDWLDYVTRYCAAYKDDYGWVVNGASNLDELQKRLREKIMVRRMKKDVLPELLPKIRQVVELPSDGLKKYITAEKKVLSKMKKNLNALRNEIQNKKKGSDEYKEVVRHLKDGHRVAFAEMAIVRHNTARAKLSFVIDYLENILESTDKVVVFAHHKDIIDTIVAKFAHISVSLTGRTSEEDRQNVVDRFQNDDGCHLFVGNIKAAGVGLTLTASSMVIFVEMAWTPSDLTQAEDRCHRIGQKDSVFVQHLVLEGSLDATMAKRIVQKQEVISHAVDIEMMDEVFV